MSAIPASTMTQVRVKGPFWLATVEVIEFADPRRNWAFRNLFLDQTPRGRDRLYLPGTLLLLVSTRRMEIRPTPQVTFSWQRPGRTVVPKPQTPVEIEQAIATGQLSLLLVQADSEAWANQLFQGNQVAFPELTCLMGEILLDNLEPEGQNPRDKLYEALQLQPAPLPERAGAAHLLSRLTVHGSGLSVFGKVQLPWEDQAIAAPFQVTKGLPETSPRQFRIALEQERLTPTEREQWTAAWNRLSRYLNPRNPLNGFVNFEEIATSNWVTLEITNPTTVPQLFWEITSWGTPPMLHFAPDEINLLLSDQSPYDQTHPPTSLARVMPQIVSVTRSANQLRVSFIAGTETESDENAIHYRRERSDERWQESLTLSDLNVAFNPVETPRFLRERQQLITPEWAEETGAIEPAILWGFMPLEAGWAQLPIPNLTEQIYLDSGLARSLDNTAAETVLLQGAVALGNYRVESRTIAALPEDEQPWTVVLTNAQRVQGEWTLDAVPAPDASTPTAFQVGTIMLSFSQPDVTLNGLFWLSTDRPSVEDALPDLENWVSGLRSFSLRTVRANADLFPPAVIFNLETLSLAARSANLQAVSAQLQSWQFTYAVNTVVFNTLVTKQVLPSTTFSRYLPWVWQRHPQLPMIQALPLTQNQSPPSYPSASRQLVPFELAVGTDQLPQNWRFGVAQPNGAARWLQFLDPGAASPAQEWRSQFDLPLVSLSLPGLALNPAVTPGGNRPTSIPQLPQQYRFDLPYTDEINALAQLPKEPPDPEAVSPLPDSPLPEPPQPLSRETFADYWQQLSRLASLASADAIEAFTVVPGNSNEQTVISNLIEPFDWSVQPTLELDNYPGSLKLDNQGTGTITANTAISLSGDAALSGISGQFQPTSGGTPFTVTAGSMAAYRENGGLRDQRGLVRSASSQRGQLIKTPVTFYPDGNTTDRYELTSALQPVALQAGDQTWQFWFRDLPVNLETRRFERQTVLSPQAEDINDPEAGSRTYNFRSGYEWRLGSQSNGAKSPAFLPLFHLHFYPLTLESVTVEADQVTGLEMIGRLQLPLIGGGELTELSNAVRVRFAVAEDGTLSLAQIQLESTTGEWLLALPTEDTASPPQLTWSEISLQSQDGMMNLRLEGVRLNFFLFATSWSLPLDPLLFPDQFPTGDEPTLKSTFTFPQTTAPLAPTTANLRLDLGSFQHQAALRLAVRLGRTLGNPTERIPFQAEISLPLLQSSAHPSLNLRWESGRLFDDLELAIGIDAIVFTPNAFQFQWRQYIPQTVLETASIAALLPGMVLSQSEQTPGFATVTFQPTPTVAGYPTLTLQTAFVETLLSCQWGEFLQRSGEVPPSENLEAQVFGSSAGDLMFGYTTQWQDNCWQESLLLNGFLEVRNLISWAKEMTVSPKDSLTRLTLPALPAPVPMEDRSIRPMSHIRHTLRILFNQHAIPGDLLTVGQGDLLFQFAADQAWQFLAVVEHQLIDVNASSERLVASLGQDRRWTTVQEIRLTTPQHFKSFLSTLAEGKTIDPASGVTQMGEANQGYLASEFRDQLVRGGMLDRMAANTLLVEASATHWVNQQAAIALNPTTLQFLPTGSQLAILSNPEDFVPSDPRSPQWLLLTLPFLGRLQDDHAVAGSDHPLQVDPVFLLATRTLADPTLALSLSSWAAQTPVEIPVSGFDTAAGRTWARLDPLSLEESWFRLQHPLPEPSPDGIQSVLAARPDTPARLSRSTALRHAFDPMRASYPPQPGNRLPDEPALTDPLVWRYNSLLAQQAVQDQERHLQVLYTFEQDSQNPNLVRDRSGVGEPIDLMIADPGNVTWLTGGGLRINASTLIQSNGPARKIITACQNTQEITIEAWVKPANTTQAGPARIVTLSRDINERNFSLAQDGNRYDTRLRTTVTNPNGIPSLSTPANTVTTELTHVVYTRDQQGMAILSVNGQERSRQPIGGQLTNWQQDFRLALANEFSRNRTWLGEYHLIAVYDRALPAAQISQLFSRGPRRRSGSPDQTLYSWHITGLQLFTSSLLKAQQPQQRHAAATLIPALLRLEGTRNEVPLSFAVSPYLGLEFRPAPAPTDTLLKLVSTELLCLEPTTGTLRPVASRFWEEVSNIRERSLIWAREVHSRQAPDSAIAVLRFREINVPVGEPTDGEAPLTTTYSFTVVTNLTHPTRLTQPVFRLRSDVSHLRFREGQFGGHGLPAEIAAVELAPPQITGVQPLHLLQRPAVKKAVNEPDPNPPVWDWGVSGLRLSVQYAKQAAISSIRSQGSPKLWWQAPQYQVQFRSALQSDAPTAGLPPRFRAPAIKTFLPVLPTPPLPALQPNLLEPTLNEEIADVPDADLQRWQPVLPGAVRYLLTGDRPGVMFALRHQLLRQSGSTSTDPGQGLVSGSIPVQHRMPRPVPLPENRYPDRALQTWASYFQPQENLLQTASPADEAFFAAFGTSPTAQPPRRLQMVVQSPVYGAIPTDWDGTVEMELHTETDVAILETWQIQLELVNGEQEFQYAVPTAISAARFRFTLPESRLADLQTFLASQPAGAIVMLQANVKPRATTDNFRQRLSFPLRITDETALPLPLRPVFIHFEDPEYNRQLVSTAAHASGNVTTLDNTNPVLHTVTLASDRREYNPDSAMALRYDWDDQRAVTATLQLERVSPTGAITPLALPTGNQSGISIPSSQLVQFSLLSIQQRNDIRLAQGDTLQFKLTVNGLEPVEIFLRLNITDQPVTPSPQAAYALLRQRLDQTPDQTSDQTAVDCARFAWSPQPTRVELVCADDLRTEVVRRRAVFHWSDAVRPGTVKAHAIQKITQTGSTSISGQFQT